MDGFSAVFAREVGLAWRDGAGWAFGLVFFALVIGLAAFAIGPDRASLSALAPGLVWLAAALASQLSLDRLFAPDVEDGTLDLLTLGAAPLTLVALAKCAAQWTTSVAPIILAAPALAASLAMVETAYPTLIVSLLLGTPALTLYGAIGAALAAGSKANGLLVALISGPLIVPTLIFGVGAARAGLDGAGFAAPELRLLGAVSLVAFAVAPVSIAAALRAQID
ncbi:MAG: heme exporter protein CcmB [Maricaulaceae bacterium]